MGKEFNLEFNAKVKADVSEVKKQIENLKDNLQTLDIPKKNFNGFEKTLGQLEREIQNFQFLSSNGVHSLEDTTKITRSWKQVNSLLGRIGLQIEGFGAISDKILPKDIVDKISKINLARDAYSQKVKDIAKTARYRDANRKVNDARARESEEREKNARAQSAQNKAAIEAKNAAAAWTPEKEAGYKKEKEYQKQATLELEKQKNIIQQKQAIVKKFQDEKILNSQGKTNQNTKQIYNSNEKNRIDALNKAKDRLTAAEEDNKKWTPQLVAGLKRRQANLAKKTAGKSDSDINKDKKLKEYSKKVADDTKEYVAIQKELTKAQAEYNKALSTSSGITEYQQKLEEATEASQALLIEQEKLKKIQSDLNSSVEKTAIDEKVLEKKNSAKAAEFKANENANTALESYNEAIKVHDRAKEELESITLEGAKEEWQQIINLLKEFKIIGEDFDIDQGSTEQIKQIMDAFKAGEVAKIPDLLQKIREGFTGVEDPAKNVNEQIRKTGEAAQELTEAQKEVERLKDQMISFFSIGNAIEMFKRALRSAFDTVKQLDEAMTETAVVTDFSVGDMWEQLPRYTESANKLGTTTLGAYQTMTLFYQQGLKTTEAFQLGEETMKMARIANLDYAKATNLMTAALRGFNMELTETSATRVNDVYSQLAAITAADTQEIAHAMTKTASIAHSANMEFETTAAFLTQIIETTRESAETAGTAMKTVIARFQELKKSPDEIGEVDGEVVDANQIESALRSVGVALRDSEGQFRNLDEVFLELASKWSGLDRNTQRYIATIAAGSRQQSRFLAMMSDYNRTMELVTSANNSAGASQKQFQKTIDSLESKLNKLKNAWDEFAMGLANDKIIKVGVDTLTLLLNVVNKLTEVLPGFTSSFAKIGLAIGALKVGRSIFDAGKKVADFKAAGEAASITFASAFKDSLSDRMSAGKDFFKNFIPKEVNIAKFVGKDNADFIDEKGKFKDEYLVQREKKVTEEKRKQLELEKKIRKELEDKKARLRKYDNNEKEIASASGSKNKKRRKELKGKRKGILGKKYSDVKNLQADINSQTAALEKQSKIVQQAEQEYTAMAEKKIQLTEKMQTKEAQEAITMNKLHKTYNATAAAAGTLAAVLGLVSHQLRKNGKDQAADGLDALTTGASVLAGILMTIPPICQAIGVSITKIPIIGWIAGIATVVVSLGVAIEKWVVTSSERVEILSEELDKCKQSAEETAKSFEEFRSLKTAYDDMQEGLKKVTKGTTEWNQKLYEANSQVLELISNYPELVRYVQRGQDGQLTIEDSGWKALEDQKFQQVQNSQSVVTGTQLSLLQAEKKVIKEELSSLLLDHNAYTNDQKLRLYNELTMKEGKTYAGTYTYENFIKYSDEDKRAIWERSGAYQNYGSYDSVALTGNLRDFFNKPLEVKYVEDAQERFKQLAMELGVTTEALEGARQGVIDQDKLIQAKNKQIQSYSEIYISQQMSDDSQKSQYSKAISSGMSLQMEGYDDLLREKEKELKEKYKGQNADLAQAYEGMTGKKSIGLETDQIIKELAKIQVGIEKGNQADYLVSKLEELEQKSPDKARQLAGLYSQNSGGFTESDAKSLEGKDIKAIATSLGYSGASEMAKELHFESVAIMENAFTPVINGITDSFTDIKEKIKDKGLLDLSLKVFDKDYFTQATGDQQRNIVNILADVLGNTGVEGVKQFSQTFDNILSQADSEQQQQIMTALSSFDVTKEGAGKEFISFLESIGVHLPSDTINIFCKQLDSLNASLKRVDVEKIKESIKTLLDLSDNLDERDNSKGITQEEYEQLTSYGIAKEEDFLWDGQKWIYLEGDLIDLGAALRANTDAILQQNKENLQKQIERGQKVSTLIDNSKNGTITLPDGETVSEQDLKEGNLTSEQIKLAFNLDPGLTSAEVDSYYKNALVDYGNLQGNINTMNNYNKNTFGMRTYSGFDTLNTDFSGVDGEKERDKKLDSLIITEKGAEQQYEQTTKAIKAQNEAYKYNDVLIKALAADNVEAEKQIKDLGSAITKNKDAFTAGNQALKAGETASNDYYSALADIEREAKKVFGDFITQDFIQDNGELFEQLAEGGEVGEKAYLQIQQAAHDAAIETLKQDEAIVGSIEEIEAMVTQANLDFTVNGYADMTDLVNKMLETYKDADIVRQKIEELTGMSVEFEVAYQTVNIPKKSSEIQPGDKVVGSNGDFLLVETKVPKSFVSGKAIGIKKDYKGAGITPKSSGGGGKEEQPWENPYDKLYNDVQKINECLRIREKLERRYQKLLESESVNADKLTANKEKEISNLKTELGLQNQMLSNREKQMTDFIAENSDLNKYGTYENGIVQIDWDLINSVKDKDEGERINKYIDKLESIRDEIDNTEDALESIEDAAYEIEQRGKDKYLELEQQIKDALVESYQKQIDELKTINDSINDTNAKVLEGMQRAIDKQRQERENDKTEQELADKQAQLDYLNQDTSGANDLAVMQLQEEIRQGQQDYTDTLIDQKINELQLQNQEAAAQRERQIAIAQAQLDRYVEEGLVWDEINGLMHEGMSDDKGLVKGSRLEQLLSTNAGFKGMSEVGKMEWLRETNLKIAEAISWQQTQNGLLNEIKNLKNSSTSPKPAANTSFSGNKIVSGGSGSSGSSRGSSNSNDGDKSPTNIKELQTFLNNTFGENLIVDGSYGSATKKAVANMQKDKLKISADGYYGAATRKALMRYMKETYPGIGGSWDNFGVPKAVFKTGGLADFTGPAWLDGTKTKPEIILNARDSENFIQLKDILHSILHDTPKSQNSENYGDNTYDIDINVESIGNDYDVEQMASKIKSMISDTAYYRNNNTINLMR